MPYTEDARRIKYQLLKEEMGYYRITDAADLSYLITQLMDRYLLCHEGCWDTYSDVLKAVDAAREAFMEDVYRPYESKKKKINSGVFHITGDSK